MAVEGDRENCCSLLFLLKREEEEEEKIHTSILIRLVFVCMCVWHIQSFSSILKRNPLNKNFNKKKVFSFKIRP